MDWLSAMISQGISTYYKELSPYCYKPIPDALCSFIWIAELQTGFRIRIDCMRIRIRIRPDPDPDP